jgi:site-specific DNA recombinase
MTSTDSPITWTEYTRVSHDSSGRLKSPAEQHADHVRWIEQRGDSLSGKIYGDASSASIYATQIRDEWEILIADLKRGKFPSNGLMIWEPSRGSRQVDEWAGLIKLCAKQRVMIGVCSDGKVYDPTDGRDVRNLIDDANDAQFEVYKLSKRIRRARENEARDGQPHGGPPFGYQGVYNDRRKPIAPYWIPEPEEADIVRELFRRFLAGGVVRQIANDFEARGFRSRKGKVFSDAALRSMLLSPNYAALRIYTNPADETTQTFDGKWTPLVSKADYYEVVRILGSRTVKSPQTGRAVHFLSGIARCGVCGDVLGFKSRNGQAMYGCQRKGCVTVHESELDTFAVNAIFALITDPDNARMLSAGNENSEEALALNDQIGALRARRTAVLDLLEDPDCEISPSEINQRARGLKAKITDLETRRTELSVPGRLAALLRPENGASLRSHWNSMPIPARRDVARMALSADAMGTLVVLRSPLARQQHCPAENRVAFDRPEGRLTA